MIRKIAIPLDGSDFAEGALPLARLVSARLRAEIHLIHVVPPAPGYAWKPIGEDVDWAVRVREVAADYLGSLGTGLAEGGGGPVHTEVLDGAVDGAEAGAIAGYVREGGVDLVLMTTHGSGGASGLWLGSVAERLVRRLAVPLLLLRPWDETGDHPPERDRFQRILVPLDGSHESESILAPLLALATAFHAEVELLQVVPTWSGTDGNPPHRPADEDSADPDLSPVREYLERVAKGLAANGLEVTTRVVEHGDVAQGILDRTTGGGADLVAMATHGRGGAGRLVLGSVADKIIRGGAVPLLLSRAVK